MIRIRYACLPQGRHATAVARGRGVFIYFRPGLSAEQRRDALQRLQRDARLGYGPPVPSFGLARALAADRAAGILRDLRAALRHHPFGAIGLAGILGGAAVCYLSLMASLLPPGGTAAGPPAAAARIGTGGPVKGALVPLATKQGHWRIPDARPRRHRPAGDGAVTGPGWHGGYPASPGVRSLRPGGGSQERQALRWWRRHGWRLPRDWPPRGWPVPGWPPPGRSPGAGERYPGSGPAPARGWGARNSVAQPAVGRGTGNPAKLPGGGPGAGHPALRPPGGPAPGPHWP